MDFYVDGKIGWHDGNLTVKVEPKRPHEDDEDSIYDVRVFEFHCRPELFQSPLIKYSYDDVARCRYGGPVPELFCLGRDQIARALRILESERVPAAVMEIPVLGFLDQDLFRQLGPGPDGYTLSDPPIGQIFGVMLSLNKAVPLDAVRVLSAPKFGRFVEIPIAQLLEVPANAPA